MRAKSKCYYVYGGEFLLASGADVCLRKTMYAYAGKTQKEKSKKFESDALILITFLTLTTQQASSAETGHLNLRPGQENQQNSALLK